MPSPECTRFGPYEIVELLGTGAMGRVYRARDPRLRREVALKVLATDAEATPQRQRRLLEEARAAGAITHQNIVAIYDIGIDAAQPYVVSELLDGETLRAELERGPVAISRLLDLAAQIADGLEAAHSSDLVHRDLKPENIIVTRSGIAKIVDFGLAKSTRGSAVSDSSGQSLTEPGTILGTAGYMSPEQASGSDADFRADQFSLGAILYEMVTGRRAFQRETAVQTLTAIIDEQPQPLEEQTSVPRPLVSVIERCLAKDPSGRYAATRDLHLELRAIQQRVGRERLSFFRSARLTRGMNIRRALFATAAAAAFAAGVALAPMLHQVKGGISDYRFTPLATEAGYEGSPVWSPDGRTIAYVGEVDGVLQVFTRSLTAPVAAQITSAVRDCREPFWSPDGSRVFYISQARTEDALWSIRVAGGPAEVVTPNVAAAAISRNGVLALLRHDSYQGSFFLSLWTAPRPGDEPRRYSRGPFGEQRFAVGVLRFSPDGTTLAVWVTPHTGALGSAGPDRIPTPEFWTIAWPDGEPQRRLSAVRGNAHPYPFSWMPDQRHIVFGGDFHRLTPGRHLWIADIDGEDVMPLTVTSGNEYEAAVSPDGTVIAYTAQQENYDLHSLPLDGSPPRDVLSTSRAETDPAWSPVVDRFAYVTDRAGVPQIWLNDPAGSPRPLVTDANFPDGATFHLSGLAFSPDGQRIAYQRRSRAGFRLWVSMIAGGPGVRAAGAEEFGYQDSPTWSPDGQWLAFTYSHRGRWRLAKVRPGDRGEPVILNDRIIYPSYPRWSPDGQWITCETTEGLSLVPADGGDARLLSEETWLAHAWSQDASRIYAVGETESRRLQLVQIDVPAGTLRVITPDLGPSPPTSWPLRGLSLSRDGQSLLASVVRLAGDVWLLDGFSSPARGRW